MMMRYVFGRATLGIGLRTGIEGADSSLQRTERHVGSCFRVDGHVSLKVLQPVVSQR